MQSKENNNLIFIRLFPEENVLQKITEVCLAHQVKTAVVLSAVGQIKSVELGFFKQRGDYCPEKFVQPLEVLAISGIVSKNIEERFDFHWHIVLSDEKKRAFGGHFIGAEISVTLEVVILKIDMEIKRKIEESTGLKGLSFNF